MQIIIQIGWLALQIGAIAVGVIGVFLLAGFVGADPVYGENAWYWRTASNFAGAVGAILATGLVTKFLDERRESEAARIEAEAFHLGNDSLSRGSLRDS
jgi:Kef-type K+ transport system membrane component KefB